MEGFYNGDEIYCKSSNNNEWHGPVVVIGQVDEQILVQHSGISVWVHSYHPTLNELQNIKLQMQREYSISTKFGMP